MDFSIPERVREIAGTIRSFLDREIVPLERQLFARGFGAVTGELDRLRDEVRRMGLFSPHLPKEWGGGGLTLLEFAHISEVLGRSPLGHYVFNCQAPDAGNMELLLQYGTDEQRGQWACGLHVSPPTSLDENDFPYTSEAPSPEPICSVSRSP